MRKQRAGEQGFALILALLALMLLTFLGLTLSATTSTELQIATNYRWNQQALYNAEAGIEAGKIVLRSIPTNWDEILPPVRTWSGAPIDCTQSGSGCRAWRANPRNWENAKCDGVGGVGYGIVLDDNSVAGQLNPGQPRQGAYQEMGSKVPDRPFRGRYLDGSFTLWVRRDVVATGPNSFTDEEGGHLTLILTAEGTAPSVNAADATSLARRAVRVLQVKLTRDPGGCPHGAEGGEAGGSQTNPNYAGACVALDENAIRDLAAIGGGTGAAK